MRYLRIFFLLLYRIWFYILVAIPILVLSPVLLVAISHERFYPLLFRLARMWAFFILYGMWLPPRVKRFYRLTRGQNYMFVANHTSMVDIMLMLYLSRNPFVFVGKKELANIPVFGFFYRNSSILVDRSDAKSRKAVFNQAKRKLSRGLSVGMFPEGHVPEKQGVLLDTFKDGAFRMAIEHGIPVVPMTFHDNRRRFSYNLLTDIGPGPLRAVIHEAIPTRGLNMEDRKTLNKKVREIMLRELETPSL